MTVYGLQLPDFSWIVGSDPATTMSRLRDVAVTAEDAGYSSLWMMDHVYQLPALGGPEAPILDGYAGLAALAAVTSSVELGTLVTGVTYRNPAHLAKLTASIDTLSGGRMVLGIGAAWYEDEHLAYGWDFPLLRERFERLREAVTICRGMFDNESFTFAGTHYYVDDARLVPRPLRRIPILIGGTGEKKTLPLIAELGDMCNFSGTLSRVGPKLAVLDECCDAVGRDRAAITHTNLVRLFLCDTDAQRDELRATLSYDDPEVRGSMIIATAPEATDELAALAAAGFDELIVELPWIQGTAPIVAAAEVLRAATT